MRVSKKNILFLLCLATNYAFGLEFYINSGREDSRDFAVLNLVDSKPFVCQEKYNRESEVESIVCEFDSNLISRFSKTNTLFFEIIPEIGENKFFLKIIPKNKIKLFNTGINLASHNPIPQERSTESTRWQIVGYKEKIPFLLERESEGLNFPISFDEPYLGVGVLDFRMRPMDNEVGQDKDYFLNIQSLLEKKSYQEALNNIDEMLQNYPETIFKRDILFMKLKALQNLQNQEDYEEIMALGKAWLNAYPADIHVPEVLLLMAENYAKMNFFEEASYYYDRLFKEYKDDKYELLARLSYGEKIFKRGDKKRALELYQSVLNQTQDLEIASLASLLLGEYYKDAGESKQAQDYLKNILDANPQYFTKDVAKNYAILQKWAESNIYEIPAQVAEVMFLSLKDDDLPFYRPLLKDMAQWYDKSGNLQKAHHYYQMLLQNPKDEAEEKEIQALDDTLLLNYEDNNATKRLEHYDYVIKTYQGKNEEKEAWNKKAETLYELQRYQDVFDIRDVLGEDNSIVLKAVGELTRESLKQNKCKEAAYYGSLYGKKIPLNAQEKIQLFDCLYENRQFIPALEIAKEQLQGAKTPNEKEDWLYRLAWSEYSVQDYPKAILASRDAVKMLSKEKYNDGLWVLFMALEQEGRREEAFEFLPILEEKLKDDVKMIEIYRVMLLDALNKRDDTAIKIYGNHLLALQEKYQKYEYSPWVELSLVEALNREGKFQESLEILQKAQTHIVAPKEQIQIFYLQGYLNAKIGKIEEAFTSYDKCEAIKEQSPWKNLCIEAKKLLELENPRKENNGE